jgi:large subunit ribosomal protein L7e
MGKNPPKWLPGDRVKETILTQRKSVEELRADRVIRRDKVQDQRDKHRAKIDAKRKRKLSTKKFIPAQTILKQAQRKKHQSKQFAKIGEKANNRIKLLGPERLAKQLASSGVALVVRAKGKLIPREVEYAFGKLGMTKLYSARLIHITNPTTLRQVKQLRPFSMIGYPDATQIDKLIRTKGCLWSEETQSKKFISGNRLLEDALGQYNVICIEDLVDAIVNKVDSLEEILKQIAPFDFHPPHALFMERHRTAHQKLEILNPESFAAYLNQQLGDTMRKTGKQNEKKRQDSVAAARKLAAAQSKIASVEKKVDEPAAVVEVAPKKASAAAAKKVVAAEEVASSPAAARKSGRTASATPTKASPATKKARK